MKRLAPFLVLEAFMLASPATASSPDSLGSQKRGCDTIKLGEPRVFYKHNMRW